MYNIKTIYFISLCSLSLFVTGCSSVPTVKDDINQYSDAETLVKDLYFSEDQTYFANSLGKIGLNFNGSSFENDIIKEWWMTSCPKPTKENEVIQKHKEILQQYCENLGGTYNNSGFCWKHDEVQFYADVYFGTHTQRTCAMGGIDGNIISYHVITPKNSKAKFTSWFKQLSNYVGERGGAVFIHNGEYTNDIKYWTLYKPMINISSADKDHFDPYAKQIREKKKAAMLAATLAQKKALDEHKNTMKQLNIELVAKWKNEFGKGTRVCHNINRKLVETTRAMVGNVRIYGNTTIGFIEDFSKTKIKIRIVASNVIQNFRETTIWDYPTNWNICE